MGSGVLGLTEFWISKAICLFLPCPDILTPLSYHLRPAGLVPTSKEKRNRRLKISGTNMQNYFHFAMFQHYCWFARDVTAAMLVGKELNSIFI